MSRRKTTETYERLLGNGKLMLNDSKSEPGQFKMLRKYKQKS